MSRPATISQQPKAGRAGGTRLAGVWSGVLAWRHDLGAVALAWALVLVFFWPLFTPAADRQFMVHGDFTNQFFPFRFFAGAEWRAGRVPLWNPFVFGGHPFLADLQTAVFYPPAMLTSVLGGAGGRLFAAIELEVMTHYLLAALFAYAFARRLLGGVFPALVTSLVFTFAGYLTSYPAQQLAMLEASVWLPLVLLLIHEGATRGRRWTMAGGLTFGLALLAGHPQTALFIGYTALAYLVYRGRSAGRNWPGLLLDAVMFGGAALGLAAVQVLPTVEFLAESTRARMSFEAAGHGYEVKSLLGTLLPGWRGERALYAGVAPLLLAAAAVVARRRAVGFWVALGVFALALSVGLRTALFRALYLFVPGFNLFRDQERAIFLFSFAMALLAGYGVQWLLGAEAGAAGWRERLSRLWRAGLAGFVVGLLAAVQVLLRWQEVGSGPKNPYEPLMESVALFMLLLALTVGWLGLLRLGRLPKIVAGGLLIALVVFDLFTVSWGRNFSRQAPLPSPALQRTAAFIRDYPELFRVRGRDDEVFPPNYGTLLGLPMANGDTPFMLQRVQDLLDSREEWRLWQLLNVRFYLSRDAPTDGLELAFQDGDLKAYRMMYPLPRIWAVRDAQVATSGSDALARVLAPKYHPGDTVILEQSPAVKPIVAGPRPQVDVIHYSPQRIEVRAVADAPAMLVLSETFYPGWQATRDGIPVPIYRANYALRALDLPPGEHVFVLEFDPWTFKAGLAISGLTILIAAGLWRVMSNE